MYKLPFSVYVGHMIKLGTLFGTTNNTLQYTTTSHCIVNAIANRTVFGPNETQTVSEVLAVLQKKLKKLYVNINCVNVLRSLKGNPIESRNNSK